MIDTPQNCFLRAAASRIAAVGPMLESVRNKHLTSAAAWESLAATLLDRASDRQLSSLAKHPEPIRASRKGRPGGTGALDGWENEGGAITTDHRPHLGRASA